MDPNPLVSLWDWYVVEQIALKLTLKPFVYLCFIFGLQEFRVKFDLKAA